MNTNSSTQTRTSGLKDLIINIIVPTFILNKLGPYMGENGAVWSLIIALSIPLTYASWDWAKNKHKNLLSLFGFVSLMLTGGLGLLQLDGIWFALKEAGIPLLIGLFALGSIKWGRPIVEYFIFNPNIMDVDKIKVALQENQGVIQFEKLLKKASVFLALSFFFSAIVNYILAIRIFKNIPAQLSDAMRAQVLNEQIAQMTWQGYVFMLVPSLLSMGFILWYLSKGIRLYTGLELNEVIKHH